MCVHPNQQKDEKWTSAKSKKKSKGEVYRSNIVFVAIEDDSLTTSLTYSGEGEKVLIT